MYKEKEQNIYVMPKAKGNGIFDAILTGLAVVGGALLTAEILKALSKQETVYNCPICGYDKLSKGTNPCPSCNSDLDWNG